ncbi:Ankyrin repeat domain-containing protein [Tetrabaena socialis]|uniref:Ankyrin repeat domain-containing protein n=1 Tax=Tetrabaena socialis TaxID=47790 RepID=A0A2J7ZN53_9CHLO|nr:Ankyrin repeat domain-containing protein [Tetrabaena socialis]|eukprot:PNH01680.1 Ankyrin repeat domain-containing protein [Tetrabaena socialis]
MEQQRDCIGQRSDQLGSLAPTLPPGGSALLPDPQQQGEAASAAADPSRIWLPELVQRYARSLSCNEVACVLRLVNKATAAQFGEPQDRTVRLSLPVPLHAFVQHWNEVGAMRGLIRQQRWRLVQLTARSGSIANLEVLLAREDCACLSDKALYAAAGAGQLDVCRWLREQGCLWGVDPSDLDAAAHGGHQDVCEWLLASGCPWSDGAAGDAARGGHVGLVDWLLGTGHDSPLEGLVAPAAAGCDLPILQRLYSAHFTQRNSDFDKTSVLACAAGSSTADWRAKVEWLEGRGFPRTAEACRAAVGQPDWRGRLEWLQQRGYPLHANMAVTAAGVGVVDALQYVLDSGVALDEGTAQYAAIYAARGGHLAVLQALHARGLPIEAAAAAAARHGHLSVVAWLAEALGADEVLSARVFAAAAGSGSVSMLAWLHDRVCPWDHRAFAEAADTGCEEQLEWLAARGCPMGVGPGCATEDWRAKVEWLEGQGYRRTAEACLEAVKQPDWRGHLEWLQQRGYPLDGDVAVTAAEVGIVDVLDSGVALGEDTAAYAAFKAGMEGHLAVLQALHARGLPVEEAAAPAARRGQLPVMAWLAEALGASKVLTTQLFAAAAQSGSVELLAWLHDRGCPWDESVFENAADTGCEEQLEWLAERGCPMGEGGEPYACAARTGELAILRCLQRLGCPLGPESGGVFVRTIDSRWPLHNSCDTLRLQRGLLWLLERPDGENVPTPLDAAGCGSRLREPAAGAGCGSRLREPAAGAGYGSRLKVARMNK